MINGYPLLYEDSASYLKPLLGEPLHPARAVGYAVFARLPFRFETFWAVIVLQAGLTSALLVRVGCLAGGRGLRGVGVAALGLATVLLLTGCARYVSWLMPHVMAGWLFLACLLWLLAGRRFDRILAIAVLAIALPAHNTHPPLLLASGLAVAVTALLLPGLDRSAKRAALSLGVLGLLAFPWTMGVNAALSGGARAFQGGSAFLVHQFVDNGVLVATLDRSCGEGERDWKLCAHRDTIATHEGEGRGWFLYDPVTSPLHTDLEGWDDPELGEVVAQAFRCCWWRIATELPSAGWRQLWAIDSRAATAASNARYMRRLLEGHLPAEFEDFRQSRQNHGARLPVVLHPFSETLLQAIWLVAGAGLVVVLARREPTDQRILLLTGTVGFLVMNAALCAAASPVFDQYQGRVAWLLPFALVLAGGWTLERSPQARDAGDRSG